ncbi:MAG: glycosyltransferase, partial [Fuerstiella sp.]
FADRHRQMITSGRFLAAGFPIRGETIEDQGAVWLARMRTMVEQWASEIGLGISDAIDQDIGIWEPFPPGEPIAVDVVIPFCVADREFVAECVWAILGQRFVEPVVHVIADGAPWPDLPTVDNLIRYETRGGWGPYRITNAVFPHFRSEWMAIQDADDISHPDRLWRQIQMLRHFDAEMISSATQNFLDAGSQDDETLQRRLQSEPIVRPGTVYESVPLGRLVNSTRTMPRDLFRRLNGFGDQFCTGDFQFDNRARFVGIPIIDDQTVLAARRLHSSSLTGGPFKIGTKQRAQDMGRCMVAVERMKAKPTIETVRFLGGLDRAECLEPMQSSWG